MTVVLAIILILMAITAAAVLRYTTTQQAANTQSLLRKLQARLDTQMRTVSQRAMQEPIGTGCVGTGATTGAAAVQAAQAAIFHIANGSPDKARIIWVKLRLKQAFPNSFLEALFPDGGYFANITAGVSLPPLPTYQSYLNNVGVTYSGGVLSNGMSGVNAFAESSACLLLALQEGQSGGGLAAEELGQSFVTNYTYPVTTTVGGVPTTNFFTVKLIVDGWGTPIAFCRWPWQCYAINPSGAPPGAGPQTGIYNQSTVNASGNVPNDPGDPRGLLCDFSWAGVLTTVGGGVNSVVTVPSTTPPFPPPIPIVPLITTNTASGLSVGQTVTIAGVGGVTGVNGTWTVTTVPLAPPAPPNSFTISTAASGTYTSGGTVSGPLPTTDPNPPPGYTTFVGEFNGLLGYYPPPWSAAPSSSGNPLSFILTPVIVSAGPDLIMALDPSRGLLATSGSESSAYDNIYSTQLQ
jgi:hypothetical protein